MFEGKNILIVGASGDLGFCMAELLSHYKVKIGAHYCQCKEKLQDIEGEYNLAEVKLLTGSIVDKNASQKLINEFVEWAGGIDYLIQLSGTINRPGQWDDLNQEDWDKDIAINLAGPFFLAQEAMKHMKKNGGKIVLCSTASASHGGGITSMAYGAAKAGIECVTKGFAKIGGKHNVCVNAVAPGFISTKFHTEKMKRSEQELAERANLVPLGRAGTPEDVAKTIRFLLSPAGDYVTGEVIAISGGDWI
jgi:NAD(P)-dependent dehydrogenase (short-subunit alcohol dehydrogenase family)